MYKFALYTCYRYVKKFHFVITKHRMSDVNLSFSKNKTKEIRSPRHIARHLHTCTAPARNAERSLREIRDSECRE